MLFLLYKDESYPNGFWWEVNAESKEDIAKGRTVRLENRCGGGFDYICEGDEEVAEADDWDSLDWKRVLLIPDSKYGYIDPDGRWYGCNFHDHFDLCRYVLNEDSPEEYGWVKVFRGSYTDPDYYSRRKFLTDAQIKTLMDRGVDVRETDCPEHYSNRQNYEYGD